MACLQQHITIMSLVAFHLHHYITCHLVHITPPYSTLPLQHSLLVPNNTSLVTCLYNRGAQPFLPKGQTVSTLRLGGPTKSQEIWGVWSTFQQKGVSKDPPLEIFDKFDSQKQVF